MPDLVKLFQKYGAYNAANLDGGGSSALYAKKTPTAKSGALLNNPVGYGYSGERRLPNAWMVLPSVIEKHNKTNEGSGE